jgi:hypothetical protein
MSWVLAADEVPQPTQHYQQRLCTSTNVADLFFHVYIFRVLSFLYYRGISSGRGYSLVGSWDLPVSCSLVTAFTVVAQELLYR